MGWGRVGAAVLVVVAAAAGGLLAVADTAAYVRAAVPVPDLGFRLAVGALRAGVEVAAALAAGLLLHAAAVAVPQRSGVLDVDGWRAARRAGVLALTAGLGALALAPLTAVDLSGTSVAAVLGSDPWSTFTALEEPAAWVVTGVLLTVCGAAATGVLTWRWTVPLAAVACLAALAPAVVGPAVTGADHDRAVDAAVVQVLATPVLGLLVGLLSARDPLPARAARRAARLVLGLLAALVVAGVASTVLRLGGTAPLGTAWGAASTARAVVALAALVAVGTALRTRPPAGRPQLRPMVAGTVGVGAVVVLGAVVARWLPPLFAGAPVAAGADARTAQEALLGYALPDAVSAGRLLLDWRFNLLFGTLALVLAAAYLAGVGRLRRRGDAWPVGRTAAFLVGCAVLLVATSSGVGRYSPAVFSVHMGAHMLLNMLVPILLAIGGPVTLALRALPAAGPAAPGPREWLAGLVASPAARAATHPLLALALFVGSFYVLYFTGLFDAALRYHWAHQAMNAHFLLVGYLFYWPLIGSDPAPVRLPHLGRLAVLLAAMPFHAFFGIAVMNSDTVLGGDFYRSLGLTWLPDPAADQFLGGGIAWAAGEAPMLLVVVVLLTRWARDDAREAARHDRRAAADGEADLAAYNAMLARLSGSSR